MIDRTSKQEIEELNKLLSNYNEILDPSVISAREQFADEAQDKFGKFEKISQLKFKKVGEVSKDRSFSVEINKSNLKEIL